MKLKCAKHNRILSVDETEGEYSAFCPHKDCDIAVIISDMDNPEKVNGEEIKD